MSGTFTRRSIAFLLAVILALVAALSVVSYLRGVEGAVASENELVRAYVATGEIAQGTLIDSAVQQGLVEERAVPRNLLAPNAVTDLGQVQGRLVNAAILPGDQLVGGRFAAPGDGVQVFTIPEGHQAMSVEVGIPPGVAGYVQTGDHVSIIAGLTVPTADDSETETTTDPQTGTETTRQATENRAQFVLQDVEVLAIGQRVVVDPAVEGEAPQPVTAVLATFAVTAEEAERLAYATLNGALWLTLLPEDETEPVATTGRTAETIFED